MAKEVKAGYICEKCKKYASFDFNFCAECGWNHKNKNYGKK